MLPVLTHHIRYHQCLMHLDDLIGYTFKERCLLQVSLVKRQQRSCAFSCPLSLLILLCFSFWLSWQWLIPVIIWISGWIPITLVTLCPTAAYGSPSTETGKCITCTWGRRVRNIILIHIRAFLTLQHKHHLSSHSLGINTLINIMSRLGQDEPSASRFVFNHTQHHNTSQIIWKIES